MFPPSIVDAFAKTPGALFVEGAPEGVDVAMMALAATARGGVSLFVARDEGRASQFEQAVKFFAPDLGTLRLPAWDSLPYDRISPSSEIAAQRCAALAMLARRGPWDPPLLVIATAAAAAQRVPPRARLAEATFTAKIGDETSMEELERYLVVNGYNRASTVRSSGEFAVRGGLIDLFPPGVLEPMRFDFFGDALETIRVFDAETQISKQHLKGALLTPVSEVLLDDDSVLRFRKRFASAFGAVSDAFLEAVNARIRRSGVEQWLPYFYDKLETVFDYVGEGALVAFEALADEAFKERVATAVDHYDSRKSAPTPRGATPFRAPEPDLLYLTQNALDTSLAGRAVRRFSAFAVEADAVLKLGGRPGRDFAPERQTVDANVFDAAVAHLKSLLEAKSRIVIAAWSEGSADRFAGVLSDHGLETPRKAATWADVEALPVNIPAVVVLPLEHGFTLENFAIISEQDILGDRLARPRKRRKAASLITEAAALTLGDLVVHKDHGVGRYVGLKTLDVQGAPHDCLELKYAGGDKLFLPVENIELVTAMARKTLRPRSTSLAASAGKAARPSETTPS